MMWMCLKKTSIYLREGLGYKEEEKEGPTSIDSQSMTSSSISTKNAEESQSGKVSQFYLNVERITVNISLVEELECMLVYTKLMKDFMIKKRNMSFKPIDNIHHSSRIASKSLVEKKKDLKAFIITCTIGCFNFSKSFFD